MIIFFRYPKSSSDNNKDIMNEVQDFSMPNKNKQVSSNKGKLDSMLDKLMKRKSCVSNLYVLLQNVILSEYPIPELLEFLNT